MNILWLSWKDLGHPLAGGAEVVAHELAKRLAAAGHQVIVLAAGFPGAQLEVTRDGYRIIRAGSRYTSYLAAWQYFRRHLRGWPDRVIDECNTMPFFAGWYTGAPTVMFFHMLCRQIWFYQFPQPLSAIGYLAEPLYLRLLKRGPVITVSGSTKADLQRHGFKARNITVIPEATNLPPVRSLAAATKSARPSLLVFGSIRPMKRTLEQIQAFELARDRLPRLELTVAGDATGPYGRRVLDYIKSSRHAAAITYAGRPTEAAKLQLMRRAHLLLAASVKEGWGLTVTEAATQGTPAVGYNADGLRDSIRDGVTGRLAAANTPAGLADAIVATLQDRPTYAKYQRAAWTWAKQLTFDRMYQAFSAALHLRAQPISNKTSAPAQN
jgi:glycosyltransferase involved in cell wall biosynthesis